VQLRFDDLPPQQEPPRAYTVSQIVHLASRAIEARYGDVWVEGEVSNLRQPSSGHLYFTLKDSRAQLAVVMFRAAATRLRFRIEDGLKLRCRGKLCIYDAQGRFQLSAETAEPQGAGALQLAFEQLRRKLEAEGLFDPAHKKPLPRLPRTIVVVTSPTGAALQDILRVLHDRFPVRVVVCPTPVQGAEAAVEVAEAVRRADRFGAELMIVARGGGSLEDLWAFNTEPVARAIYHARTPVMSAVGHEGDVTIADLVADRRAPTPSAAAEMAVPVRAELAEQLRQQSGALERALRRLLGEQRLALLRMSAELGSPRGLLDRARMRLDDDGARLAAAAHRRLRQAHDGLGRARERLSTQEPRLKLHRHRAALVGLRARLERALGGRLQRGRSELGEQAARLEALSPLGVLARGYSIVLDRAGQAVRDARALRVGDRLLVRLQRGGLRGRVEEIVDERDLDPARGAAYDTGPGGGKER
jgi:exodeoxyribonuclease VII large subunit